MNLKIKNFKKLYKGYEMPKSNYASIVESDVLVIVRLSTDYPFGGSKGIAIKDFEYQINNGVLTATGNFIATEQVPNTLDYIGNMKLYENETSKDFEDSAMFPDDLWDGSDYIHFWHRWTNKPKVRFVHQYSSYYTKEVIPKKFVFTNFIIDTD